MCVHLPFVFKGLGPNKNCYKCQSQFSPSFSPKDHCAHCGHQVISSSWSASYLPLCWLSSTMLVICHNAGYLPLCRLSATMLVICQYIGYLSLCWLSAVMLAGYPPLTVYQPLCELVICHHVSWLSATMWAGYLPLCTGWLSATIHQLVICHYALVGYLPLYTN